jgi:hypothetical protein
MDWGLGAAYQLQGPIAAVRHRGRRHQRTNMIGMKWQTARRAVASGAGGFFTTPPS